jgi:hypothetical protein
MTDRKIVSVIHSSLQRKDKWFIDFYCPDDSLLQDVCSQAKEHADERLPKLSINALYSRYRQWRNSEAVIPPNEGFFQVFLSQVCFDLGLQALKGEDKIFFSENCILTHKFLS